MKPGRPKQDQVQEETKLEPVIEETPQPKKITTKSAKKAKKDEAQVMTSSKKALTRKQRRQAEPETPESSEKEIPEAQSPEEMSAGKSTKKALTRK